MVPCAERPLLDQCQPNHIFMEPLKQRVAGFAVILHQNRYTVADTYLEPQALASRLGQDQQDTFLYAALQLKASFPVKFFRETKLVDFIAYGGDTAGFKRKLQTDIRLLH